MCESFPAVWSAWGVATIRTICIKATMDTVGLTEGGVNRSANDAAAKRGLLGLSHPKPIESLVTMLFMWLWIMKFPCVPRRWTTGRPNVQSFLICIFLLSFCFDSSEESENLKEGCVHLPRLPFGPCLLTSAAPLPKISYGKEKEAGEPAEFWWILTRWELEGKEEKRRLRHYWDEMVSCFVHFAVSV